MLRDLDLAFMRIHVLYHAAEEPFYGAAMMEELRRHGYQISAGTFYPLLHKMEEADLLACTERVVEGRQRKYYAATPDGEAVLDAARAKLEELAAEVIEGHGPGALPDPPPDA
jgi:DNA-binding PadR family transcriptional regulator